MDALTEALNGVRLRNVLHCPSEVYGEWGMSVANQGGAPYYIVLEGGCLLDYETPSGTQQTRLRKNDFVVLPHDAPHTLKANDHCPIIPLTQLLQDVLPDADGLYRFGTGPKMLELTGGTFYFEEAQTSPLLRVLPPLLHVRCDQADDIAWLSATLAFVAYESRSKRPGSQSVITRLADILFVQAVRAHVCALNLSPDGERNWLRGLLDPQIGPALTLIHRQPEAEWTVEGLAAQVAMSRSAFAARFANVVGEPPLRYVTRWRIHRAALLLRQTRDAVASVAAQAGYASEAAFSTAFRQWTGQSPAAFRRAVPALLPNAAG